MAITVACWRATVDPAPMLVGIVWSPLAFWALSIPFLGYVHRCLGNGWPNPMTHVANAYSKTAWVRVSVNEEKVSLPEGQEWTEELLKSRNYKPIDPTKVDVFKPGMMNKRVHINVVYSDENGQLHSERHSVAQHYSVIVDEGGKIKETRMGELWVDKSGRRHLIKEEENKDAEPPPCQDDDPYQDGR